MSLLAGIVPGLMNKVFFIKKEGIYGFFFTPRHALGGQRGEERSSRFGMLPFILNISYKNVGCEKLSYIFVFR
jgi:hypothetical protein